MRRRVPRLVYLIPILALAGVILVYALGELPVTSSPAAMDFVDQFVILYENNNGTMNRALYPPNAVGEPGGLWATTQYNSYGVDPQHYPLYMDPPTIGGQPGACQTSGSCLFHVKSKTVHQYTLGDFFNVWGQPIGVNNTVGIKPLTNQYGTFGWQMCTGPTGSATPTDLFGNLVLQPNIDITLVYYNTSNGVGCA